MQSETVSAPWFLRLSWEELLTLSVCLALDIFELAVPMLLGPFFGDIIDFMGLMFTAYYFRWFATISLLELMPGLDPVPLFTATWLAWYIFNRRRLKREMASELEKWL